MIKAVIFDFGGVLLRTEDDASRRALEAQLGLSPWESEVLVFSGEKGTQAQMGTITTQALWDWIQTHLELDDAGLEAFEEAFWGGDVLDEALVAYIRQLRPHYQTAMISNATDTLREGLIEKWQIADAFDLIVVSAEEKVMKPDLEIYERTLRRLGRRPEEAVFIDDNQDNIEAARALGMETVHVRPGVDVIAKLQEILS